MPHDVSVEPISLKTDHGDYIAKFRATVVWKSTCRKYNKNKSLMKKDYSGWFQRCPLMGKAIPKFDSKQEFTTETLRHREIFQNLSVSVPLCLCASVVALYCFPKRSPIGWPAYPVISR